MIHMTNGHTPAPASENPPQVVQLVLPRRVSRVLGYLVAALLGGAAGKTCSVREDRPKVSAAVDSSAASAEKCSPPCPPGQTCRNGTCYAVASEGSKSVADSECMPVVEIIFRTRQ